MSNGRERTGVARVHSQGGGCLGDCQCRQGRLGGLGRQDQARWMGGGEVVGLGELGKGGLKPGQAVMVEKGDLETGSG